MQESYAINMVEGTPGLEAELGPKVIGSFSNPLTTDNDDIPFGRAVTSVANEPGMVQLPVSGQRFEGVALRDASIEGNKFIHQNHRIPVMSFGRVYVQVEETVAPGDSVYFRHAGKVQVQTITFDADLIAANQFDAVVDGVEISEVFDTNHLTTMNAIAAAIEATPNVETATVGGGGNRVITVTASSTLADVVIEDAEVTLGVSQAGVVVAETVERIPVTDSGLFRNDSDGGTATQSTRSRWIKGATAGNCAILEVSLP